MAQEIDVAFWNEGDPAGLFAHIILVECKNWSSPAGLPLGIFVAAAGITGDPSNLTAAHSVLAHTLERRPACSQPKSVKTYRRTRSGESEDIRR